MQGIVRTTVTLVTCAFALACLSLRLSASDIEKQQNYDVVVAGAGTGGVAAAIHAARLGSSVALLEESDWIGGQMTAAGVGNMDEGTGPGSTPPSGFYAEFLGRIRAFYQSHGKSIGTCYWHDISHCFDPRDARRILTEMIDDLNAGKDNPRHGHIDLFLEDRVVRVLSSGVTVTGVVTSQNQTLHSKILIDATEYGDVIPLTPARYRSGHTLGEDQSGSCIQAITWTAVIKKYPQGTPSELLMHNPPPGYDRWVQKWQLAMRKDGNSVNRNLPVDFAIYNGYRGFPDLANPEDYTGLENRKITRTSMNWFNDFDVTTALYNRDQRKKINCEAKLKTLANLYYIQNVLGETQWSVANDEGFDSTYNKENSCAEIPAEFKALEYNMPQHPYVRESIRLVGEYTLTGGDIRREGNWMKSVNGFTDAVAVGDYADDLHSCNSRPELFEQELEHITDLPPGFRFGPFQVPMRSFIPETVDGLLAAEKNISQSRLTNGATRLQPITMLTGEAAGTLAGLAVADHLQPRHVSSDQVQIELLKSGDILAREHMADLTVASKAWQAAQFAAIHQWIALDDKAGFQPTRSLTRAEGARILVNAFLGKHSDTPEVANTGGFDPAPLTTEQAYTDVQLYDGIFNSVAALHAAGAVPVCVQSPEKFCPNEPLTLGEFLHSVVLLSAKQSGGPAPNAEALRNGVSGEAGDPVTREAAALILYNSVLLRVEQAATTHKAM